jgi:carboxylesterase
MEKETYQESKSAVTAKLEDLSREERDILDKPFCFSGTNSEAVLLIHGWTSVPYELRRLGTHLNKSGYTVQAPLLSGHGTVPKNLENIRWTDWLKDVSLAYAELEKNHKKVYVIGTSIGANLSVMLAKNNPQIAGLVLLAMPYKIRLERWGVLFAKFLRLFKKYNRKRYLPGFGSTANVTRSISYQVFPIESALEVPKLTKICRKILKEVRQPCYIMQSTGDYIVSWRSLDQIYAKIGSEIKKKKYIKRAYHTFITDIRNEDVFEEILNFINSN